MQIEEIDYRIERKGETLQGYRAIFEDNSMEFWDNETNIVEPICWGNRGVDLSQPTTGELYLK